MKTLKDMTDETVTDKWNGDVYSEDLRESAIEWIKTLQYVISKYEDIDHRDFTWDNFIEDLNKKGIDYRYLNKTIFKHDEGLNSDSLEIDGKALLMHIFDITEDDLK